MRLNVAGALGVWLPSVSASLYDTLQVLGIPLGAIVVGLAFGLLAYVAVSSLRRRPHTEGAGTVRVSVISSAAVEGSAPPQPSGGAAASTASEGSGETRSPVLVPVYGKAGEVRFWMRGPGEFPSVPLHRARRFVVVILGSFIAISLPLLLFFGPLFGAYDHLVGIVGAFLYWPLPWPGVYATTTSTLVVPDYIFPMYLAGMGAFAIASGLVYRRPPLPARRRWLALAAVLLYFAVELVLDALFFTIPGTTYRDFALIARAFNGGVFLAMLAFCTVFLPVPQRTTPEFARDRSALYRFVLVGLLAFGVATAALVGLTYELHLRGLLLSFTVLLLLPLTTLELFATFGRVVYFWEVRKRHLPSLEEFHPSVTVIMPAFNEEEWIESAILSVDRAAAHYPGRVDLVVGNDGSTDHTLDAARAAIGKLENIRGVVVDLPHGGKSNALNGALALASGEIVIRLDGDTYMSETPGFAALIPHFADPRVGGVQGAIHPRQTEGWTRKLRALEIAWNHYFLRPGTMGTRTAEVIDGLFSAFRRKELVRVGGYVPWNGEDTEIAIRLQRLGYRVRIEFGALAFEDVPHNYNSLRRQRVRWARGILMANGQHYPALLGDTPEYAGLGVLLWFLLFVRSGVRSLVYVFLGLLILVRGVPAILDTGILFGCAIALRAGPLGVFLVRMKRRDALPWIPFFPVANLIKQTFRFEAFGTLGPDTEQEYY